MEPATRVDPEMGASVIVHHLGHSSKGLRGSMNIGQQLTRMEGWSPSGRARKHNNHITHARTRDTTLLARKSGMRVGGECT